MEQEVEMFYNSSFLSQRKLLVVAETRHQFRAKANEAQDENYTHKWGQNKGRKLAQVEATKNAHQFLNLALSK